MAKIKLFGKVTEVFPVEFVGETKTAKQAFVLFVPGYSDPFDRDKKVFDEEWLITILGNDKVLKFGMNDQTIGRKCECEVFINSKRVVAAEDNKDDWFPVSVVLGSIEMKG